MRHPRHAPVNFALAVTGGTGGPKNGIGAPLRFEIIPLRGASGVARHFTGASFQYASTDVIARRAILDLVRAFFRVHAIASELAHSWIQEIGASLGRKLVLSNTDLQPGLRFALLAFMHAMMRSTLGISAPQSRNASRVQAAR